MLSMSALSIDADDTLQVSTLISYSLSTAQNSTPSSSAKAKSWAAAPLVSGERIRHATTRNMVTAANGNHQKARTTAMSRKAIRKQTGATGYLEGGGWNAMSVYSPRTLMIATIAQRYHLASKRCAAVREDHSAGRTCFLPSNFMNRLHFFLAS